MYFISYNFFYDYAYVNSVIFIGQIQPKRNSATNFFCLLLLLCHIPTRWIVSGMKPAHPPTRTVLLIDILYIYHPWNMRKRNYYKFQISMKLKATNRICCNTLSIRISWKAQHTRNTRQRNGYILGCRVYRRKKLNEDSQGTRITPAVPGEYQDRGEIIVMHNVWI